MAYRKTEKVLAELEAVRNAIVGSAIDIISKSGLSALTMDGVRTRAGCSAGTLYNRFPDITELMAAVTTTMLNRDLGAIHARRSDDTVLALAGAVKVIYARLQKPRLLRALMEQPAYRLGIRAELERLIGATGVISAQKDREIAAAGALGAIVGMADIYSKADDRAPQAVLFVLRGIGFREAALRKVDA